MKKDLNAYKIKIAQETLNYSAPKTRYCLTKLEFNEAVGTDFISTANNVTKKGEFFLVGLSHGQSPSGVYQYILDNYSKLKNPELIHYTCINSKLTKQRGLVNITDAISFLKELISSERITKNQIIGRSIDRDNIVNYKNGLNRWLGSYLKKNNKEGLDYVFLASNPKGLVAGITKNSPSFDSDKIATIVFDNEEDELTYTPYFLKKSKRIAFLATKAEKRRPLAWLYYRWGKKNESPSFLRFIDDVENRMTVFIDDHALTWPQTIVKRKTKYGISTIKVDLAQPYDREKKEKLPVILMIHGFLGLNTFDGLLAFISSEKYISAAMHYGSIPTDLPPKDYSKFVVKNIDHVVNYFGKMGHPVYILDHSIANNYLLMMNDYMDNLNGIKKHLKGRIAANPFFGQEAKHASLNFIEEVALKSSLSLTDKAIFQTAKGIMAIQPKESVTKTGIFLFNWMIRTDSKVKNRIWKAIKQKVLSIMVDLDTIPELNKVPLEHTLNRLPVKIFVIQIQSALKETTKLKKLTRLDGFEKYNIPTLVLKSEKDPIARFIPKVYESTTNATIIDITNHEETALFKEHLFYMIHPHTTINIIDNFIAEIENKMVK